MASSSTEMLLQALLWKFPFSCNTRTRIIPPTLLLTSPSIGSNQRSSKRTLNNSICSSIAPITSSSTISTNEEVGGFVADQHLTLRNICEGRVPDHVLRRSPFFPIIYFVHRILRLFNLH